MQIKKRTIEYNLIKKGFVSDDNDHRYYYHEYKGKRTGTYAFTSRGSQFKDYGVQLINLLKKELKLDTLKQANDLLTCPMSKEQYEEFLIEKGVITKNSQ
jgi:hypothetical protein